MTARVLIFALLAATFAFRAPPHPPPHAPPAPQRAAIKGIVWDSISERPLVGANVQLVAADAKLGNRRFTATTDSIGRFAIPNVPSGRYVAGFYHPLLDSLGAQLSDVTITITDRIHTIALSTPGPLTILRRACGDPNARTAIIGHVHDAENEMPLAKVLVFATWPNVDETRSSFKASTQGDSVRTDDSGAFIVCDVPMHTEVRVRAVSGADSSGAIAVEVAPFTFRHLSLYVLTDHRDAAADSTPTRLTGRVRDENGRPVAAARILVLGTRSDTVTDEDGTFRLTRLVPGSRAVNVRAVGFAPTEDEVQLLAGRTNIADFTLHRVTRLDGMTVRAAVELQRRQDAFEENRRTGAGYFASPEKTLSTTDIVAELVRELPGMQVEYQHAEWSVIMNRPASENRFGAPVGTCSPTMILNGKPTPDSFDDIVKDTRRDELVGVEMYPRESMAPAKYARNMNPLKECGLIAVWTRPKF
ncbi:MAG TPA: carboxypeptidase-like regulatory domain-containing protein [Gemmatimonadaceae bacterium]|nr:carboxypeptidase-like regulatory domain-containing protein [Gemmatimonadaceae bacterium]